MVDRADLMPWIIDGLKANSGKVHFIEISKHIWKNHQRELEASGNFFYKWQYEMRWAGNKLVNEKKIIKDKSNGVWELVN
jgi:hypothetical protein